MTAYEYRLQKGKVASDGIGKVILIAPVAERRVEDLVDVLRYEHPLGEHPEVNALSSLHARFVGETHHALRELGADRGWDLDALEAVYRQVVDADYRFNGVWAKPKWNASRTRAVGVEWRTGRQLELGFTVTPKGGETRWAPFLASRIGLGKIDTAAGKLVWQDDRHALLWHSNKRDRWRIDTETLQVDFLYAPAEDGNPHGQYQFGKMYLDGNQWVGVDPVKARYWLAKSADQGFARAKRLLEEL
jgi:TPR repeat protein